MKTDPDAPTPQRTTQSSDPPPLSLPALAGVFLKLGTIGFGGGMAMIALMENELVRKRRALPSEEFVHGVGLSQVLGPFSVNTALFVGYRLHGPLGGLACAGAFLVPSVVIVILLSWLYFTVHELPALGGALAGLGPVVIALILSAAWSMGQRAVRSLPSGLVAVLALALALLKVNAALVLFVAGGLGVAAGKSRLPARGFALVPAVASLFSGSSLGVLALTFLKVGAVFFGGGFVLVATLHQELVVRAGWLTEKQFVDGVAISNLTPGPIAVLATFAGYHVGGVPGALVSTLALFAPATVLMIVLSSFYARHGTSPLVEDFLAGVSPAVVGLVGGAALLLAPGALHGPVGVGLVALSLLLLVRLRWHPAWVLTIGALLGATGEL